MMLMVRASGRPVTAQGLLTQNQRRRSQEVDAQGWRKAQAQGPACLR